jgi:uncharacterized membrane protein
VAGIPGHNGLNHEKAFVMTAPFDPWADEKTESPEPGTDSTHLLAVEFDDPMRAQEALLASLRLHKRAAIRIEDAAIVVKEPKGRIRIHQTKDVNPTQGAVAGSWIGLLGGLIFMVPLIGAALGAAVGGLWAKLRDIGISDDQMRRMGEDLAPGDAALFLLLEPLAPTNLVRELRRFNGIVLYSNLDDELTAEVAAALDEIV